MPSDFRSCGDGIGGGVVVTHRTTRTGAIRRRSALAQVRQSSGKGNPVNLLPLYHEPLGHAFLFESICSIAALGTKKKSADTNNDGQKEKLLAHGQAQVGIAMYGNGLGMLVWLSQRVCDVSLFLVG